MRTTLKPKDRVTYFDQGLRLVDIDVQDGNFTAVWRPGLGGQWWVTGWNDADFKAKDKEYFDQGFRLVCLRVHSGKITAVWRSGTGTQWWVVGSELLRFRSKGQSFISTRAFGLSISSCTMGTSQAFGVPALARNGGSSAMTTRDLRGATRDISQVIFGSLECSPIQDPAIHNA